MQKKIRIAVLGAGWFGCFIGTELKKKGYLFDIYEKNSKIFSNASGNNQNRLHLGFHYPRSYKTREMSQNGFYKFKKNLPNFSNRINDNIYAIANDRRNLTSFKKYISSLNSSNLNYKIINIKTTSLKNISYAIKCDEEIINQDKAISFFKKTLKKNLIFNKNIKKIKKIGKKFLINKIEYDFVINCTWQQSFSSKRHKLIYENCLIPVYKLKVKKHPAYTIMDGPFFTFYPWKKNYFGLYSVKYSRVNKSKSINKIIKLNKNLTIKIKNTIKSKIERKFSKFYPEFKKKFIFQRYLTSIRTILYNKNDARVCLVENDNNFVNILSGKIDHIFYAASEVIKCLNKY